MPQEHVLMFSIVVAVYKFFWQPIIMSSESSVARLLLFIFRVSVNRPLDLPWLCLYMCFVAY